MQVSISHTQKTKGVVFKTTLHGVVTHVTFNQEELSIIQARGLQPDVVLERGVPADVDADKHAQKSTFMKIATVATGGSNNFHLTVAKLMKGPDTYFMTTPIEAKNYEDELKGCLRDLKNYIVGNAETGNASSFEL